MSWTANFDNPDYGSSAFDADWTSLLTPNRAALRDNALVLELAFDSARNVGTGAQVSSHDKHTEQYGELTAVVKSGATHTGVACVLALQSQETRDEISFEWVGKDPACVQTNYSAKGAADFTTMVPASGIDTTVDFHTYAIRWTPEEITWRVDGRPVRTLRRADTWDATSRTHKYPDSAAGVELSIWDDPSTAGSAVTDWAGGPVSYAEGATYSMLVRSVTFTSYS
ncbi:family 16 glycosylhydrolase [Kitasatospora sp. NPDC048365]|uniref:family 16 glycosylhydrolase n=1 Tax=Kitasatospora sp. NPDC048365 TaxID=3364050 RepID=UPI003722108D